jgi:hypothetical protein
VSAPTPKEIREQYTDDLSSWKEIRDEAKKDMQCINGDPWGALDPAGKRERTNAGRPLIAPDELGQYINQVVNDVRQNERGIKIDPAGNGATDKTAEFRQGMIRGIEYRSKASQAYTTAFENALQRSYGYFAIGRRYENDESFNQELYIRRIPNPDSVLISPDYKDAVASDMDHGFICDLLAKSKFSRKYPKAKAVDFSAQDQAEYEPWIGDKQVQIAEYWYLKTDPTTIYLLDDGSAEGKKVKASELKGKPKISDGKLTLDDRSVFKILKDRKTDNKTCIQLVTNGVDILEEMEFGGPYIPLIPVFGKELFIDDGAGSKRKLNSLVRLARDPFMLYCYYRTCEAEMAGMTPKIKWVGYAGQFKDPDLWANAHKSPRPYLEVEPMLDGTGQQVLPLPQRQDFNPPLEAFEAAAEASRRAIQAAMGISPLPTATQRQNEKSGVALKRIETQEAQGSYHFVDNLDYALEQGGRVLDWHLGKTYDTAGRQVPIHKDDGKRELITINSPHQDAKTGEMVHYDTNLGDHDVTVSTGPSYNSQREAAADFADTIVSNIEQLPIEPTTKAKFLSMIIKLKNLGPIGDAMVSLLDPEENSPQAQAAKLAQATQQLQMMQQGIQQLQAENQDLKMKQHGKVIEGEYRLQLASMQDEIKVLIAEIQTKAQKDTERDALFADVWKELHGAAHDAALQAQQHGHEADMAQQQAAVMQQQAAQPQPAQV